MNLFRMSQLDRKLRNLNLKAWNSQYIITSLRGVLANKYTCKQPDELKLIVPRKNDRQKNGRPAQKNGGFCFDDTDIKDFSSVYQKVGQIFETT